LKESISRSVELVHSEGAPSRVVKRFASRGWLSSFFDRRRAHREYNLLAALRALRLPVPAPLELRRTEAGFEILMEWLAGTVNLARILRGSEPWPTKPAAIALRLGNMLAEFHACGLDHPDLHPGNVLIDPVGRPYLVDFHKAALRPGLKGELLVRDLIAACASARETTHPRFRSRFFLGWLAALPQELRSALPPREELVKAVESQSRVERRSVVLRRSTRWLRRSSDCARIPDKEGVAFQRAELPSGFARGIQDGLASAPSPARARAACISVELPFQAIGFPRALVLTGAPLAVVRGTWLNMVRLEEHAIPGARPLCFFRGRSPWAAFELLPGERLCSELAPPVQLQIAERSLPALSAALLDRLLAIPALGAAHLLVNPRGNARLAPTQTIIESGAPLGRNQPAGRGGA
jgi:tRNA A-37 threonylcarbamoyl transferase component Bud32